jgi:hypothetical protein
MGYVTGCGALALGLVGCSVGTDRSAVSSAAVRFVRSVEGHDGASACGLLTSAARSSVSGATNVPCAKAILSIDERGTSVTASQVWGDAAQVHLAGDVIFLRRVQGGWHVSAAGCTPRPSGPYDCDVSG